METVAVDCRFAEDGAVQVRKVHLNGRWQSVGQGWQWLDENGRHVLIMWLASLRVRITAVNSCEFAVIQEFYQKLR